MKKNIFWFIAEAKIGNIRANIGKSGFFPKINWERGQNKKKSKSFNTSLEYLFSSI